LTDIAAVSQWLIVDNVVTFIERHRVASAELASST
jgi:hypothetical protein